MSCTVELNSLQGTTNKLEGATDAYAIASMYTSYSGEPTVNHEFCAAQQSDGTLYNKSVHAGMYQGLFSVFPEMKKSAFGACIFELIAT